MRFDFTPTHGEPNAIKRTAFEAMHPADQMAFCRLGGKVIDDPAAPKAAEAPVRSRKGREMSRIEFDRLALNERTKFILD